MGRHTKRQTRSDLSPLWSKIAKTQASVASLPYQGGEVRVERVYHRGRTGPAWTPSWEFRFCGRQRLQSDSLSTFVDQMHHFWIEA